MILPGVGHEQAGGQRMNVVLPAPSGPISPVTTPGANAQADAVERGDLPATSLERLTQSLGDKNGVGGHHLTSLQGEVVDAI